MYSTKAAFELYIYYLALKKHFTSSYDFFKYNGKIRASVNSFETRRDKFYFYKLSKKHYAKDLILANMLNDPTIWIGDLFDSKAEDVYKSWLKRKEGLTYTFKSDISKFLPDFDENLIVKEGQHPPLLKLYLHNEISLETLVIVTSITGCLNYWEKKISETIVFPNINNLVRKYEPFMDLTKDKKQKFRQILLHKFNTT